VASHDNFRLVVSDDYAWTYATKSLLKATMLRIQRELLYFVCRLLPIGDG